MKKILLLLSLTLLLGCADVTTEQIGKLKVGMTLKEMKCVMGETQNIDYGSSGNTYNYTYKRGSSMVWIYIRVKDSVVTSW